MADSVSPSCTTCTRPFTGGMTRVSPIFSALDVEVVRPDEGRRRDLEALGDVRGGVALLDLVGAQLVLAVGTVVSTATGLTSVPSAWNGPSPRAGPWGSPRPAVRTAAVGSAQLARVAIAHRDRRAARRARGPRRRFRAGGDVGVLDRPTSSPSSAPPTASRVAGPSPLGPPVAALAPPGATLRTEAPAGCRRRRAPRSVRRAGRLRRAAWAGQRQVAPGVKRQRRRSAAPATRHAVDVGRRRRRSPLRIRAHRRPAGWASGVVAAVDRGGQTCERTLHDDRRVTQYGLRREDGPGREEPGCGAWLTVRGRGIELGVSSAAAPDMTAGLRVRRNVPRASQTAQTLPGCTGRTGRQRGPAGAGLRCRGSWSASPGRPCCCRSWRAG